MRTAKETALLLAVLGASLVLRFLPISADLPSFSSLDELSYVETALRFGTGKFRLLSYFHGGFYQLVLFVEYVVYFLIGRVLGIFGSATDFLLAYLTDPTRVLLLARVTVALCGVGIVWLSSAIATTMYGRRAGLLAAVFTAFSLLMFQMSFLALADIPAVFLLMLAMYFVVRSMERPADSRLYGAAAVLVGLAAATKYTTAFGIVPLSAAACMKCWDRKDRTRALIQLTAIGGVCVAVGFLVGLPQVAVDPRTFYEDVFHTMRGRYLGYDPNRNAWRFLFTNHLRNGLGIPLEIASLLGVVLALLKRSTWDIVMLSFPIAFYLFLMRSVGFAYHLLPAIPFMLILASRFLDVAAQRAVGRESLGATLVLACLVVAPTLVDSLRFVQVMRSPSTRMIAKAWIESHIPTGSTIMAEGYTLTMPTFGPPLIENRSTLERDIAFVKEQSGVGRPQALLLANYDLLYQNARTYDIIKVASLLGTIPRDSPRYVITTSSSDSLVGKELESMWIGSGHRDMRAVFKADLVGGYTVLATFAPPVESTGVFPHLMDQDYRLIREWPLSFRVQWHGPTITVWERRAGK